MAVRSAARRAVLAKMRGLTLTDLADNLGNKIHYTLDAMGNRTKEEVFDPSSVLRKTQSQVFDALSRLKEIRGANGQLTEYGYDPQGNRTSDRQASAFTTLSEYDALDRLNKTTDAAGGITQYSYNALDQLTGVTDPKSLSTSYTYSALGDLTQLQSPDTGTTTYTYDSGGNRKTQLDARGITATYSYDSLNRITTVDYPGTAEDVSYSYDAGSNGIGRLTGISDQSGTTAYTYDPRGTLKTQSVTVIGRAYVTQYRYDAADRLTGITYPSGRVVSYVRDTLGRISQVSATVGGTSTPIESGIQYLPFGPWTQANLGNGIAASRSFDQDYRITAITAGTALSRAYDQYDLRNNLKHIADGLSAGKSQTFGYDALSRLSSAAGSYGSLSWTYADASGDRKTQTRGTAVGTYAYPAASHRLSAITGDGAQSFTYDNAGNTTQIGSTLYDRNSAGRLSQIRTPACTQMVGSLCLQQGTAVAATYTYNALGQRISKSGTVYQYDQSGNLMSESTSAGINQRDYLYADDQLIAIVIAGSPAVCTQSLGSICLQQSPAVPEQIHYAHLDHLGTPQAFTNQAKAITWNADYEPFGKASVTTATLTSNIRLPGQYFDSETGLHQNWNRNMSPVTGRYIESDPIGLIGGINTYAYVGGNPVSRIDPFGLWSFTFGGYIGPGAEVTFGNDSGNRFVTYRAGIGFGAGASYDPNGTVPGDEPENRCKSGEVLSASAQANFNVYKFGAGVELGAARNYRDQQSSIYGGPSIGLTTGRVGFGGGASVGGQITFYIPIFNGGRR